MKKLCLLISIVAVAAALIAAPATAAQFYETFDSYSGVLSGQGGWMGNADSQIIIEDGSAKLTYDQNFGGTYLVNSGLNVSGDIIYFKADVYAGGTGDQGNSFDIEIKDAQGLSFARWYGGWNTERPRIGGLGLVLPTVNLVTDDWNELMVVVDTLSGTSSFYLNGSNLGFLDYKSAQPAISNTVDQIRMGFQNATDYNNGSYKYYDNIYVGTTFNPEPIPEPSSLAAFGMFGLGALGYIKRRRA